MLQSVDPELANAEAEDPSQRLREMQPDLPNLRIRGTGLARDLVWLPGQHASRPLWKRCRNLSGALKRLLRKLESPPPKAISDDFRWLHDNLRLLEAELEASATWS